MRTGSLYSPSSRWFMVVLPARHMRYTFFMPSFAEAHISCTRGRMDSSITACCKRWLPPSRPDSMMRLITSAP